MSLTIAAADVKKLRDLTDAPIMECKQALVEAEGDQEKALEILRKKGQAAAQKRAGRSTSEGLARVAATDDGTRAVGLVVECETDFVSANADFKAMVDDLAAGILASVQAGAGEIVLVDAATEVNGKAISAHLEDAVAKIRENIQLRKAVVVGAPAPGAIGLYNHHTGKSAALTLVSGDASNGSEIGGAVAAQSVAFSAEFLHRDEVPADVVEKEIELETQRAVAEGKPEETARKIAQGRVQKEFFQSRVLLEQPFWSEPKKKTGDYVAELAKTGGGSAAITAYVLLKVGG
jgi:elongation factor Ts